MDVIIDTFSTGVETVQRSQLWSTLPELDSQELPLA